MNSDCVEVHGRLRHPPQRAWEIVGSPELYPRFVRWISWCEPITRDLERKNFHYAVRACLHGDDVVRDELHALVYRQGTQLVFSSVFDDDRWFSLRLAADGTNHTEINLVLALPQGSTIDGTPWTKPSVRKRFQEEFSEALTRADAYLGAESGTAQSMAGPGTEPVGDSRTTAKHAMPEPSEDGSATPARVPALRVARTLAEAGVFSPSRPDRMVRQLRSLQRWGPSVAGGYRAAAARAPNATAVADERRARTFRELDERSTRLAHGLHKLGVDEGTRVALLCRNHVPMVEGLIACAKIGADAVLLNTGISARQTDEVVEGHGVRVILADDEFAPLIRHLGPELARVRTWPRARRHTGPLPALEDEDASEAEDMVETVPSMANAGTVSTLDELVERSPDDEIPPPERTGRMVVLTSGTTGTPRGARRPNPAGLGDAAAVLSRIPLRAEDRMLVAAPLFHTWGLAALQLSMPLRASLILQRRFDAEQALRAISEHRATVLIAVPIMLQRILDLPPQVRARYDTSSLRIVASSGSALPASLVSGFLEVFGPVLYNLYGSTEVSWASIADPADLLAAPSTAGRPPRGTRASILDSRGGQAPAGTVGRVYVGNDMLFDGYTNGTTSEMARDLMDTGDQGYLDADGRLFVSGRADEMIVSGGENVFPRPVEELLAALPQVSEVAVTGVADKEYGERLAAFIVLRPRAHLDAETVRDYVHGRLARFSVPRDVTFVEALPRNATGKVLKRLLSEGDW